VDAFFFFEQSSKMYATYTNNKKKKNTVSKFLLCVAHQQQQSKNIPPMKQPPQTNKMHPTLPVSQQPSTKKKHAGGGEGVRRAVAPETCRWHRRWLPPPPEAFVAASRISFVDPPSSRGGASQIFRPQPSLPGHAFTRTTKERRQAVVRRTQAAAADTLHPAWLDTPPECILWGPNQGLVHAEAVDSRTI